MRAVLFSRYKADSCANAAVCFVLFVYLLILFKLVPFSYQPYSTCCSEYAYGKIYESYDVCAASAAEYSTVMPYQEIGVFHSYNKVYNTQKQDK